MNSAGVMQRRGFLAIMLLGAVVLTVYMVHARLGGDGDKGAARAAGAVTEVDPSASAPASTPSAVPPSNGAAPVGVKTTALTGKEVKQMGNVVLDSEGWMTYRFDLDSANPPNSTCFDACLRSWLPVLVDGIPALTGVDAAKVGTIDRPDGGKQLTLGGWPLYRFLGDNGPAKWKGQAVNNSWWVVQANGARNVSCLPPGAVAPPS